MAPEAPAIAADAPSTAATYNAKMQDLIQRLLIELGEDPAREGLVKTPKRVDKALRFLTSGYAADIDEMLNGALFSVDYSEMVIVRDIDFYSMCEHHLLPFFGKCHVAYIPERQGDRPQQDPAPGRHFRAAAAAAGAHDQPDRAHHPGQDQAARRRRGRAKARTCAWRCAASRSRTRTRSPARCSARSAISSGREWNFSSC